MHGYFGLCLTLLHGNTLETRLVACRRLINANLIIMLILIAGFHKLLILINWLQNSQLPITAASQC